MTKSTIEIEREVEDARGRVDRTVEALKDKLQPKEMFDEATRIMGGTSNKVLTTAVEQLRENPVPIALIGLGVAWLAISQTRRPAEPGYAAGYYPTHEGYDEEETLRAKVHAKAEAAKAKLTATADKAKAKLANAQHQAEDGVAAARGKASEYAHLAQDKAGEYGRAARARFDETLDAEPLVIGAIGLAVGAAIGAALPATPVERRYFGPTRTKAAEAAKEQIDQVKGVAQRAYDQVKDELHRQTGPAGAGASLAEKAKAVAEAGARTVREDLASH